MSSVRNASDRKLQLGALLRLASQAMNERLAGWLAESGFKGLQPAHSAVIQPLWEQPRGERVTTLARVARITKQSMSALIADLETGGYVERVVDDEDARAVRIRLTERGRAYGRAVRAFARQVESEWAAHIGAEHVEALRTALVLLRERVLLPQDGDAASRARDRH
jgi:DNA-binding MarR family transcriptional regulator